MPSFIMNENKIVVAVLSFEPVSPEQHHLSQYDPNVLGKRYENGVFHDVEQLSNDSTTPANDGSNVDV